MPAIHELKCLAPFYDAIVRGEKTFDVRKDDRAFQTGDTLNLQRVDATPGNYVHYPVLMCRVVYVLRGGQFGIEPGYVVLGIRHGAMETQ